MKRNHPATTVWSKGRTYESLRRKGEAKRERTGQDWGGEAPEREGKQQADNFNSITLVRSRCGAVCSYVPVNV